MNFHHEYQTKQALFIGLLLQLFLLSLMDFHKYDIVIVPAHEMSFLKTVMIQLIVMLLQLNSCLSQYESFSLPNRVEEAEMFHRRYIKNRFYHM